MVETRGRKPKPKALRLIDNNAGKRTLKKKENEALTRPGYPAMPDHLSRHAKEVWPRFARLTMEMGVLSTSDGFALEMLCEAYADVCYWREQLQRPLRYRDGEGHHRQIAAPGKKTYTKIGKNGIEVKTRPEYIQLLAAEKRYNAQLATFGLTPASRGKVEKVNDAEKDEFFD